MRGMSQKRAQVSGTGAAVLILIIAALIIVYILFLPPQERARLLGEPVPKGVAVPGAGIFNETLLVESPGRLSVLAQRQIEHPLPAVNIYAATRAHILKQLPAVYVRRGVMENRPANITFSLDDVAHTRNVQLSFLVRQQSGRLSIGVNGYDIFHGEVTTRNIEPMDIPHEYLRPGVNVLRVEAEAVGLAFWRTNEYALEDVKLTADVTDIRTREAALRFIIGQTERENIERAFLKFLPYCEMSDIGPLQVTVNERVVFAGVPDCGIPRPIELLPHSLIAGENAVRFFAERGTFLIDNVQVETRLREPAWPTYYFIINAAAMQAMKTGRNANLVLEFADDTQTKRLDVLVNGQGRSINTKERVITIPITLYVRTGNNVVELRPRANVDILELRIGII